MCVLVCVCVPVCVCTPWNQRDPFGFVAGERWAFLKSPLNEDTSSFAVLLDLMAFEH